MTADLINDAGRFRTKGVGVFSGDTVVHMAPPASLVPQLIGNLFAWIPIESLIHESRQQYYDALDESGKKGNSTYFVEFMLSVISNALNMYEMDVSKLSVRLSEKEQTILNLIKGNSRITIAGIVEITGYPRSTVTRIIKNMLDNGVIERVGPKKNGYWMPRANY